MFGSILPSYLLAMFVVAFKFDCEADDSACRLACFWFKFAGSYPSFRWSPWLALCLNI